MRTKRWLTSVGLGILLGWGAVSSSALVGAQEASGSKPDADEQRARIEKALKEFEAAKQNLERARGADGETPFFTTPGDPELWTFGPEDSLQLRNFPFGEVYFDARFPEDFMKDLNLRFGNFWSPQEAWSFDPNAQSGEYRWHQKSNVNGTSIEVTNENGEVTVKLNGEVVDDSRLRRNGNMLEILDEDGNVIQKVFESGRAGTGIYRFQPSPGAAALSGKRPTIGVQMEPVSEALAYTLDIDGARSILVGGVIEGQPAEQAGLERFDVIIGVDGSDGVSMTELRAIVAQKKAGDTLDLSVLRRGRPQSIQITVAESQVPFVGDLPLLGNLFERQYRVLPRGQGAPGQIQVIPPTRIDPTPAIPEEALERIQKRLERLEKMLERMEKASDKKL